MNQTTRAHGSRVPDQPGRICLVIDGAVAQVILDRADKHNALDRPMLAELARTAHATDLTLTGCTIDGRQAHAIGLTTRISDNPLAAAVQLAEELAILDPDAVWAAKTLLSLSENATIVEISTAERQLIRRNAP